MMTGFGFGFDSEQIPTPYVKEEVTVTKKPVTETKKVREEVTSEMFSTEDSQ